MPLCALLALAARSPADDPALNLPIGDPARRGREAPLVLDAITDTGSDRILTPAELPARLSAVRLLFVGESHTSVEFHRAQQRVVEELRRAGRKVLLGLEMYPVTEQVWLDRWSAGELSEAQFVEQSHWYRSWGYHWDYYRDIFLFARDNGVRMFAVNAPREVISAVRRKGFAGLAAEEAAVLPGRVDTGSAEHRRLFKAFFGPEDSLHSSGMSEEQWEGLFRAQCAWDAAMAYNAVKTLETLADPGAIMVVLLGSGHVAYGLGAERQAALWFDGRTASLVPVPLVDGRGERVRVRASYANFLWGLPRESDPPYPTLGLSTPETKQAGRLPVIAVSKRSAAAAAGFKIGDQLVSMDGTPIDDKETFNRLMAGKRWGDAAVFKVERGQEVVTLTAHLRRSLPEASAEPGGK
jgi:uncharacterized iron-regulated protein